MKHAIALGLCVAVMAGCGDDGSGATSGTEAPVITRVSWQPVGACEMSVPSDMMVTVTATDADTAAAMLSYSGNVSSCASLTGAVTTVRCPQRAQYTGRATVRDPDGNEDSVTFSFGPCQTGSTDF